jgi:hypothetical protein
MDATLLGAMDRVIELWLGLTGPSVQLIGRIYFLIASYRARLPRIRIIVH